MPLFACIDFIFVMILFPVVQQLKMARLKWMHNLHLFWLFIWECVQVWIYCFQHLAGLILLKVFIFIYTTQVISELVGVHVGKSNVLHGLLEFAKLLRIVQNVAFSFCKHQIDVLHDILFEPIKSQKFRIEDLNVWIIGV